jgi:hypothetical protein
MLTSDANTSYGTGTTPTKTGTWYGDSNVIFLKDFKKLSKFTFHAREGLTTSSMQIYVLIADYNAARGFEPNAVEIINENLHPSNSLLHSNQIIPPINDIRYLLIANPKPVPCFNFVVN